MAKICKIEVIDFKNVKIHNLDPDDKRVCMNKLKFKDPKARYMPSVRLGRWDGTVSFFSAGGNTYINFLPMLIEILDSRGYDFEIIDRRPEFNLKFNKIKKDFFKDFSWSEGHPNEGEPIELHDHQVNAVNALLENDAGLLCSATSSGKTLICSALAKQVEKYGRTITVVPSRDLVDQTYADFKMLGLDTGRIYHGLRELDNQHTICTWQSLHSINKKSKEVLSIEEINQVLDGTVMTIQDEVHLATGKVIFNITSNLFRNIPLCYGLTGTIPKEEHNRETLRANYGEVVYEISAKELQDKGILSNCKIDIIQIQIDKKTHKSYADEKKYINNNDDAITLVANDIIELSKEQNGNTFVLVENLDTGYKLRDLIPDSVFLSGKDKSKDRKKEYKEMNIEDNKVIIATYGIASTGISINRIFQLVLFNPGKSFTRTIQSIGRGLRIAKDKDFVNIKDYSFNTKYSSRHLTERKSYYKEHGYDFSVTKRKII